MMKRFHALVALAALFSLVALGGCATEEAATTDDSNGGAVASGGGEVDLTTVDLKAAVAAQIAEADEYGCCLKMPCSQCIVNMGKCPCGEMAQTGGEVCQECKGGWAAGGGGIDGLTADDINVMPRGGGM